MIAQFNILCRVKQLREDRALRTLRAKQSELAEATAQEQRQRGVIDESTRTMPDREKALYDRIMGKVVDMTKIEETKERVLALQVAHQALEDELERRIQIKQRIQKELETARLAYQMAQRTLEKFTNMAADAKKEAALVNEMAEENEIEELFSKGQALVL